MKIKTLTFRRYIWQCMVIHGVMAATNSNESLSASSKYLHLGRDNANSCNFILIRKVDKHMLGM